MRITGEPKEPNLESFSLTWSANHLSVYNSSRPYRRVILQPVHLSGIRQSVCSHGTVGYLSSKVCLGMRQQRWLLSQNQFLDFWRSPNFILTVYVLNMSIKLKVTCILRLNQDFLSHLWILLGPGNKGNSIQTLYWLNLATAGLSIRASSRPKLLAS